MIPMFTHDVDGKLRNNKRLLPKRNWCSITEYVPGSTPPPTPSLSPTASQESLPSEEEVEPAAKPPSALQRTLSLGRGDSKPAKLIRRLSLAQRPQTPEESPSPPPERPGPRGENPAAFREQPSSRTVSAPIPTRPNFQRQPTTLEDAAKKGGADDESGHINLEWGLDIKLNCEIKQGDPSGGTESYRLLVPALFFADEFAPPPRKPTLVRRLTNSMRAASYGEWARGGEEEDESDAENAAAVGGAGAAQPPSQASIQADDEPPQRRRSLFRFPQRGSSLLRRRRTESMPPASRNVEPFQPRPRIPLTPQQGGAGAGGVETPPNRESPMTQQAPAVNVLPRRPVPAAYPAAARRAPSEELSRSAQPPRSRHQPPADDVSDEDESDGDAYDDEDEEDEELEEEVVPPRRRVASKFDASGASKFFGAAPVVPGTKGAQGPLYGDARDHGAARRGSYGATGNIRDSWASNDSRGYDGIEAFKEKKGWRRLLPG
jgi:hypothetical protein